MAYTCVTNMVFFYNSPNGTAVICNLFFLPTYFKLFIIKKYYI